MNLKTDIDDCKHLNLTDELAMTVRAELPKLLWFGTPLESKPLTYWTLLLDIVRVENAKREICIPFGGLFTDLDDVTAAVDNAKGRYAEVCRAQLFEFIMQKDGYDYPRVIGLKDFPV